MIANAEYARLSKILSEFREGDWTRLEETVYRYVAQKYSGDDEIASGRGAYAAGGRWNAPGAFHAVYCASTALLAHEEYFQGIRLAGLEEFTRMPLVGKALRLNLERALDLRDEECLKRLGLTASSLRDDPWRKRSDAGELSLCQAVGSAALANKCQALIVPSAVLKTPEHYNIVVILENIRTRENIQILK